MLVDTETKRGIEMYRKLCKKHKLSYQTVGTLSSNTICCNDSMCQFVAVKRNTA